MDRFAKLVIGAGLLSAACAHAGYAWPADPKGFVRGGSWGAGYGYAASANDSVFGKIIHQPNGLKINVGGKMVTMPASYKFAANAPRVAAGVLFMNPAVRFGLGIAAWLGVGKIIWDEATSTWRELGQDGPLGGAFQYMSSVDPNAVWYATKEGACGAAFSVHSKGNDESYHAVYVGCTETEFRYDWVGPFDTVRKGSSIIKRPADQQGCPAGWTSTPAGCLSPALTQPEFVDKVAPNAMPETVPKELPDGTPLPVEPSPGPWVNPEPGTNPQHRPIFVPTGDPVPNPNYNPNADPSPENQPYIQPGVRLNPSPSPNDPFRIDVKPIDRPKPENTPMPGPESEPSPNPSNPNPNPGDKPKPEESPGLCDLYPDILACAKLDTPSDQDIPASEKPISITPDSGWGPDGGTCPAPRVIMTQGRSIPIPFDLFCTYMQGMRPIIIAMAWLSAAFILIGAREGN